MMATIRDVIFNQITQYIRMHTVQVIRTCHYTRTVFVIVFIRFCILNNLQEDLDTEDFAQLSAPLLYEMFKAHTKFPLHLAIQHRREDVVFLFLIEYNLQVHMYVHAYVSMYVHR